MKDAPKAKLQFRVLYRQFLFRVVDLEVLSAHALGDSTKLLGQFAALLIFVSILLAPLLGFSDAGMSPYARLAFTLYMEHFLVATTMLAVGIFAVLSWDSIFPDRRDVLVLAPLPVRAWTMFLAKVAATATVVILVVVLLNCATGLAWPLAFAAMATPQPLPVLTLEPAQAPLSAENLEADLDRALNEARTSGWLAPGRGTGLAIGVFVQGARRVFTYGAARPDSLFEIGSLTKPLTALILARMVEQGKARLDEPVRRLLPPGTVTKPTGREITLLDLATHRSGLPPMPDDSALINTNPCSDYSSDELYAYLRRHGVEKPAGASYVYSNLGFGLLGQALSVRVGTNYATLLREEITGPLGLEDTVVLLSGEQKKRFLEGFDETHRAVHACDPDVLAGAGAIRSTAPDLLRFLEANLHPEKTASLTGPLVESHRLRDNPRKAQIALAWAYNPDVGIYWHDGATAGFTSEAFFDPKRDCAAVVLLNLGPNPFASPYLIAEHIRQRLSGEPAISLDTTRLPASAGLGGILRWFAAYWLTMLAAGTFVYFGVLGAQGLAAQLPSRSLFLRVSGFLQMAAFCLFVCVYFLEPPFEGIVPLVLPNTHRLILWLPSYWFVGLFHQLNGSMYSGLAPLARRAWMGLGIAGLAAVVAYAMCYMRTLRRIVEEPDITSSSRGLSWLPRFGNQVETAIGQFSVRTLARSRQHRLVLAFYLGVALALTILLLEPLRTSPQLASPFAADPRQETNTALLTADVMTMVLALVGLRVVFALPLEPPANWIFRIIGVRRGAEIRIATRRVLLLLAVAPIWVVSALLCFRLWPWRQATAHLFALALLGMILVDVVLYRFRKIPFTCSYLPGKSQVHMVFLGAVGLVWLVAQTAVIEQKALESPRVMAAALVLLGLAAAVLRWRTKAASSDDWEPRFEETPTPAVLELGLFRDGAAIGSGPPNRPFTCR